MYTEARTMRTFFCWTEHRFTRSTIWAGCSPLSIRILSKTWISIKAVFPARYGGRLSSVVDVRTKEGNMKEFHGTFSLGLLDGRVQFEGPIIKDKTSFNIAMRRSWVDLFTAPAFFLLNRFQSR